MVAVARVAIVARVLAMTLLTAVRVMGVVVHLAGVAIMSRVTGVVLMCMPCIHGSTIYL